MRFFVTNSQLHERDRMTKIEATLEAFSGDLHEHKSDCLVVREDTKKQFDVIKDTIDSNHEEWKKMVTAMDVSNVARLRWQQRTLVGILLAILGFLGEQMWMKIFTIHTGS